RLQAAEPDHSLRVLIDQPPKAEAAGFEAGNLPRHEFANALVRPGLTIRNVAHHCGILRDWLELHPVVFVPGQKAQSEGFEHREHVRPRLRCRRRHPAAFARAASGSLIRRASVIDGMARMCCTTAASTSPSRRTSATASAP